MSAHFMQIFIALSTHLAVILPASEAASVSEG